MKEQVVGSDLPKHPSFSVDLEYSSTRLKLELMMGSQVYHVAGEMTKKVLKKLAIFDNKKMFGYVSRENIPLWFNVNKYVLLTRYNGTILGESERRLMLSSLMAALDASQVQVPAFVSASPLSSISRSLEVLGYMIMNPRQAEMTLQCEDSIVPVGPTAIHFESQTLSGVGSKHPFFYLDGLMRLFGTKLWKFSRGIC